MKATDYVNKLGGKDAAGLREELEALRKEQFNLRMQAGTGFPINLIYRAEKIPELVVDVPGDTDGDQDLDLIDLASLQAGFTGPGQGGLPFPERLSDHDGDGDLDDADVVAFVDAGTGPAR